MSQNGIKSFLIDGSEWLDKITRVTYSKNLNQPDDLSFETKPEYANEVFGLEAFMPVQIIDDEDNVIFGGRIVLEPQKKVTAVSNTYTCACKSWAFDTTLRQCNDIFRGMAISDIYKALVDKYFPDHTVTGVQENTDLITIKFQAISVFDALTELARLAQWQWRVDQNKDHIFEPVFLDKHVNDLTDSLCDVQNCSPLTKDLASLANSFWIEGGETEAQNATEITFTVDQLKDNLGEDIDPAAYPLWLPVGGKTKAVELYALVDVGAASPKQVFIHVAAQETVGNTRFSIPQAKEDTPWVLLPDGTALRTHPDLMQGIYRPGNNYRVDVIPEFNGLFIDTSYEDSIGGRVYLTEVLVKMTQMVDIFGWETMQKPSELETLTGQKIVGFLLKYKRTIKINYRPPPNQDSIAKYGIRIDMPKVSLSQLTEWSLVMKYADYLNMLYSDPSYKGTTKVWRYRNGTKFYPDMLKPGWLIDRDLTRLGATQNARINQVSGEITPYSWTETITHDTSPTLLLDYYRAILLRLNKLENMQSDGSPIESVRDITSTGTLDIETCSAQTVVKPEGGYDELYYGASTFELA